MRREKVEGAEKFALVVCGGGSEGSVCGLVEGGSYKRCYFVVCL